MYITLDTIIEISKVIGALSVICGVLVAIYKIVNAPKELKQEITETRQTHADDIKSIENELCVLSYAMLATLDGLKQLNCNGNVTEAHDRLSKHLNQKAHDQI